MDNSFYDSFDIETAGDRSGEDYRTDFQRDRDRLIHSFAFRRLQDKTQVFLAGEYDFYRTRLTHSIEVAQIGRSICHYLRETDPDLSADAYVDPALVEAGCMAHDLGHPPFGHAGERTLNALMGPYGGFEGNAQTLRILTQTLYSGRDGRRGMDPTRALIDGILKYKTLRAEWPGDDAPEQHFLYDAQSGSLDFVFGGRAIPEAVSPGRERNRLRSIECQIMNWADDTAYSVNDLIDGVRAGFITPDAVERWAEEQDLSAPEAEWVESLAQAIRGDYFEPHLSKRIGEFIQATSLVPRSGFMSDVTRRYAYDLHVGDDAKRRSALYGQIAVDLVFQSPQVSQLEHKGDRMLRSLFEALADNYLSADGPRMLLPREQHRQVLSAEEEAVCARRLCDYVAGMTDGFAVRTYKRLFDPDFGSIIDLV